MAYFHAHRGRLGVGDIVTAVVDGLKGFPKAINAVFSAQTCIVHPCITRGLFIKSGNENA
jgi:transposase-like protein